MSDQLQTKIAVGTDRVTVTTGKQRTVFRHGDDLLVAEMLGLLQEEIERLRTQLERGKAHAQERVALIEENQRLRDELRHLQRKVDHGCAGFYCEDCDKESEVSDE